MKKTSKTKRAKEVTGALASVARLADSLDDALADKGAAAGSKAPRKGTLGAKARMRLISAETERFSAVLQHAAFQQSPFETIEKHLSNSVAAQAIARVAHSAIPAPRAERTTPRKQGRGWGGRGGYSKGGKGGGKPTMAMPAKGRRAYERR